MYNSLYEVFKVCRVVDEEESIVLFHEKAQISEVLPESLSF